MSQLQWEQRLVHFQYVQELLEDRRILAVGCGSGRGVDLLSHLAKQVLIVEPSSAVVDRYMQSTSWTNVEWVIGEPDRMQVEDHSIDVVLVPELHRWVARGTLLPEIHRVLASKGVVQFGVPSGDRDGGDGMAFEDLEEYLSQSFKHVRLMGVIPFFGQIVADFEPEGDLDPQLDCSLVAEDEDPHAYIALCSHQPLPSIGYSVLQIPPEQARIAKLHGRVKSTVEAWTGSELEIEPQLAMLERVLERETTRVEGLELRLQQERDRLDQERARAEELSQKYTEQRSKASADRVRSEASERSAAELRKRSESAERRCDSLLIHIEQGAAEVSNLHQRLAELQGHRQADQWQIDELLGRLRAAERRLESGGTAPAGDPGLKHDLEQALAHIGELEREIAQLRRGLAAGTDSKVVEAEHRAKEAEKRTRKRLAKAERQVQHLEQENAKQLEEKAELEKELMRSESRVQENSRKATNAESKIVQMEVRLKRAESEAATLSKWAEELREELKEAQGKSTVRPVTPEPEVAALRNDLAEARERISGLEGRCDRFIEESEQLKAAVEEKENTLQEALKAVDSDLLMEVLALRQENEQVPTLRKSLAECEEELVNLEGQLRDAEQAEAELHRTRGELKSFRKRVQDVDAASEELERLRLEATEHREVKAELKQLKAELEYARIELTRSQDELRGAGGLPEEAAWDGFEEDEPAAEEVEGYVGEEMEGEGMPVDEEETGWPIEERVRVQERQLEALLEGAALHREEMERHLAQVAEMDALVKELQVEQQQLEQQLAECRAQCAEEQQVQQQLREENQRHSRELARAQGELQRSQDEQTRIAAGAGGAPGVTPIDTIEPSLQQDLDREVRVRQQLQEDLERRLEELDEVRKQLREKDRTLDGLRSDDTEHRAELRELQRKVRELERSAETASLKVEQARERPSRKQQLADQLADAEEHITALTEEIARCRGNLATVEQALTRSREQQQSRERELDELMGELTRCEVRSRKLDSELKRRGERIRELERKLEQGADDEAT